MLSKLQQLSFNAQYNRKSVTFHFVHSDRRELIIFRFIDKIIHIRLLYTGSIINRYEKKENLYFKILCDDTYQGQNMMLQQPDY